MLALSQVIYGVQNLDVATRQIESRGFTVVDGGRHPGLGTANRIVPLGDAYFEILGIVDRQEALRNPFGSALNSPNTTGKSPGALVLAYR